MITFGKVKVEGLKELESALATLPKAVARNALRRVLIKRAQPMVATAKFLAPDDPSSSTPDLKTSIFASIKIKNKVGHAEYSSVLRQGGSKEEARTALRDARSAAAGEGSFAEVYVGPDVEHFYGRMQEFGTRHHSPKPFLRPAWDQHQGELLEGIKDDFWVEIKKASARYQQRLARVK